MATHLGVTNITDLTAPAVGHIQSAEKTQDSEIVQLRNEFGVTVKAVSKKMNSEVHTITGKGDAELAAVTAGEFTAGVAKIVSAKQTENQDDFPDFEITANAYDTLS